MIQSLQKADSGWFVCTARNLAGNRETKPVELKIIGETRYLVI